LLLLLLLLLRLASTVLHWQNRDSHLIVNLVESSKADDCGNSGAFGAAGEFFVVVVFMF